jgi:two-component system sensor histidine kinase/response regulator
MFHQTLEQSRVSLSRPPFTQRRRVHPDPLLSSLQDQHALQQQIHELQARNQELRTYAHTVAHDLKGPLGTLSCLATILQEEHAQMPVEEQQTLLTDMTRVARKMGNTVDELLLLAEVGEAEIETEPLDMAAIVAEAQARLAHMVQDSQAEIVVPAAWPVAKGRAVWVEEVWVNYLSNAIKYGGWPPHVELNAATQLDGRVCFWVRDNGPGIELEDQARLFKPFTRLDQARAKGHGLGLSVVRQIVEKLGGEVGVTSVPGHGSMFSFTLPAVATAQGQAREFEVIPGSTRLA